MYRNHSPFEVPELTHKDNVISTLKRELIELQDVEVDFYKVNDEITRLESKYSTLVDQKDRNEKQHKHKIDIGKKAISELRSEMDKLKIQIHKATSQIQDTLRESNTLKRLVDSRNTQIDGLIQRNTEIEKRNELQAQQNRNITFNIKQFKEQKAKLQTECQRIHSLLDSIVLSLKNTEKEVKTLDAANSKLEKNIIQAQRDNQDLLMQLKAKETSLLKTEKTLQALLLKTDSMKQKNKQLQTNQQRLQGDVQKAHSNLNIEITRNKDITNKLRNLENTIRATQEQLQQVINKKDKLKDEHFELIGDNRQLNTDIDTCLMNILQFEKQNEDLQREIENYIQTDEEARKLLDRKNVMKTLLEQVNNKLEKTSEQIAHLR